MVIECVARADTSSVSERPGSAGVPPAPGRRPAMDDPPKAHRCAQAGKMPALPGGRSADCVDLPEETQNENCCTNRGQVDESEGGRHPSDCRRRPGPRRKEPER